MKNREENEKVKSPIHIHIPEAGLFLHNENHVLGAGGSEELLRYIHLN